jgi:hypothetical protein
MPFLLNVDSFDSFREPSNCFFHKFFRKGSGSVTLQSPIKEITGESNILPHFPAMAALEQQERLLVHMYVCEKSNVVSLGGTLPVQKMVIAPRKI